MTGQCVPLALLQPLDAQGCRVEAAGRLAGFAQAGDKACLVGTGNPRTRPDIPRPQRRQAGLSCEDCAPPAPARRDPGGRRAGNTRRFPRAGGPPQARRSSPRGRRHARRARHPEIPGTGCGPARHRAWHMPRWFRALAAPRYPRAPCRRHRSRRHSLPRRHEPAGRPGACAWSTRHSQGSRHPGGGPGSGNPAGSAPRCGPVRSPPCGATGAAWLHVRESATLQWRSEIS